MEKMEEQRWLSWAKELQFIAQAGLAYSKDPYDLERFQRVRDLSAEIMADYSGVPVEVVKNLFCNETGYQTPKLDTRAAIFKDGKMLLVKERDGLWSMPGGWVDALETVRSNTEKEVREEAGLDVRAIRVIALHDKNKHNIRPFPYNVCKVFVECEAIGGCFHPNVETVESGYFTRDGLPPLATEKNTEEQIDMCFRAHANPQWEVEFD